MLYLWFQLSLFEIFATNNEVRKAKGGFTELAESQVPTCLHLRPLCFAVIVTRDRCYRAWSLGIAVASRQELYCTSVVWAAGQGGCSFQRGLWNQLMTRQWVLWGIWVYCIRTEIFAMPQSRKVCDVLSLLYLSVSAILPSFGCREWLTSNPENNFS